jgi:hypothetical protein
VKTSSYRCNTSSDVFSIKSVTSARLCFDPKPACTVRHRQEISRKKETPASLLNYVFFIVACVNDRLWCNLSGHSSPGCTGAELLLVAANTLNAPVYPDVIYLISNISALVRYFSPYSTSSSLSSLSIFLTDPIVDFLTLLFLCLCLCLCLLS